ncbi:MAG TPA: DUF4382 domain-containing protein [Salinimicrobium sp.]|nr:DUF4382 domain-containing protein [Salinimicrobium sp.]
MKKFNLFLLAIISIAGFGSCSDDNDSPGNSNDDMAHVSVQLTDAPGDYKEVWVEVEDVMVKMDVENEDADEEGWITLGDIHTGRVDLLTLTGGETKLLADAELPPGKITGMRLVLGGDNTIVTMGDDDEEGVSFDLQTPSAEQSGLKIQADQEIEGGLEYNFILDFDVDKSIVKTGNGNFILKPVIRASLEEMTGSIIGSVHPTTEQALVVATNGSTTVSAYTGDEGKFELHGLKEGTYIVTVHPDEDTGWKDVVTTDVEVESGGSTDMGIIYQDSTPEGEE